MGDDMKNKNIAIVSYKELSDEKKNPTLCLSALRGLNKCHQCDIFKQHMNTLRQGKKHRLACKPHIPKDILKLLRKKNKLLDELAIINATLEG